MAHSAAPASSEYAHPERALLVCLLAIFMVLLDVSIVNVALPPIQRSLQASPAAISWIVSGYALTFGLVLVPAGRVGDDYGRKHMFQIGLLAFVVTSALCAAAPSSTWLVVARLLQGIAGGMLTPQIFGLIQQLFSGRDRGRAFGYIGLTAGLSTALGPVIGGLLITVGGTLSWRLVFLINLPVGIIALAAAARLLPAHRPTHDRRLPDLGGISLLGLGIGAFMLPFVRSTQAHATPHWWLTAIGVLLLAAFWSWTRRRSVRGRATLINPELLRVRGYTTGVLTGLVHFGFPGTFLVLTLYYQQGLGYSPLMAGLGLMPFAAASAISPNIGGRIVHRYGRVVVVVGSLATTAGLAVTALLIGWAGAGAPLLVAPLFLAGFGSGLVIAPNQTLALDEAASAEGGTAGGVIQTAQRLGTSIGIAFASALFFNTLSGTNGDFHAAATLGLIGTTAFVGLAICIGLAEMVVSRKSA